LDGGEHGWESSSTAHSQGWDSPHAQGPGVPAPLPLELRSLRDSQSTPLSPSLASERLDGGSGLTEAELVHVRLTGHAGFGAAADAARVGLDQAREMSGWAHVYVKVANAPGCVEHDLPDAVCLDGIGRGFVGVGVNDLAVNVKGSHAVTGARAVEVIYSGDGKWLSPEADARTAFRRREPVIEIDERLILSASFHVQSNEA
jgi:hypothetical protein